MPLLNVENARENLRRYPWAQAILESWKQQVAHLIGPEPRLYRRHDARTHPLARIRPKLSRLRQPPLLHGRNRPVRMGSHRSG